MESVFHWKQKFDAESIFFRESTFNVFRFPQNNILCAEIDKVRGKKLTIFYFILFALNNVTRKPNIYVATSGELYQHKNSPENQFFMFNKFFTAFFFFTIELSRRNYFTIHNIGSIINQLAFMVGCGTHEMKNHLKTFLNQSARSLIFRFNSFSINTIKSHLDESKVSAVLKNFHFSSTFP